MAFPAAVLGGIAALKGAAIVALGAAFVRFASLGVLAALSISIVTFTGVAELGSLALDEMEVRLDGLPVKVLQIVALTQIDVAFAIVLAAEAFRASLGGFTRWVKGPRS